MLPEIRILKYKPHQKSESEHKGKAQCFDLSCLQWADHSCENDERHSLHPRTTKRRKEKERRKIKNEKISCCCVTVLQ